MKVEKRTKRASAERMQRYRELCERIARTNDTGLSDNTVRSILNADRGRWTSYASAEEMFASLGIEMS
jgi:hypothetical protein